MSGTRGEGEEGNLRCHTLLPGEYCVRTTPCLISTIVGSCVAVTLHNRDLGCGGMNHFILPVLPENLTPPSLAAPGRYGETSTTALLRSLLRLDEDASHLEAMIFGGGRVIDTVVDFAIGDKNVAIARKVLAQNDIRVVREQVLPPHGLKIVFAPHTGEATVTVVRSAAAQL